MKTLKSTIVLAIMLLLAPMHSNAQDMYYVHQDVVKPSKVIEYEGTLQEIMALAKKHNLQDTRFITLVSNNSNYSYVMPLANMAALDEPSFPAKLAEKAGKDVVKNLFDKLDKCYDIEMNYTLILDRDLTYMPNGFTQTPAGENYRNNHFFHIEPGNRAVVKEKMKAVKDLFESKGSKLYYRVYKSGFGTPNEYYMVAVAAKDVTDMELKGKTNEALLGDALQEALNELYFSSLRYEKLEGNIRPDISYSPNQ